MATKKIKKLTPKDIEHYKQLLIEKRHEILGSVNSMENEALHRERSDLSNMPIHMADASSDNFEIENTLGLLDSEQKILREIYDALQRIEEGTFGICDYNDEQIPKARLDAIPWAKYCIKCASEIERNGKRYIA